METKKMPLNEKQQLAIKTIMDKRYRIVGLIGAGGTGKSYTISKLPSHINVAYTAPTHKAVSVLSKSEDIDIKHCMTLCSFLGLKINENSGNISLDKDNKSKAKKYDILVVDEASMVGKNMVKHIKDALNDNPYLRLVVMGDSAQLPPVNESGCPLFKECEIIIELTEQNRQKGKTHPLLPLLSVLRSKNSHGIDFKAFHCRVDGVGVHVTNDQKRFEALIKKAFCMNDGKERAIVAYTNEQVDYYNAIVHKEINHGSEFNFVVGDVVALQKPFKKAVIGSKYDNGAYKTEDRILIGEIEPIYFNAMLYKYTCDVKFLKVFDKNTGEWLRVCNDRNKFNAWLNMMATKVGYNEKREGFGWHDFYNLRDSVADVRLCHAMTVHKSQGSTFDNVFVDVKNINKMRDKEEMQKCLYTAISRAKHNAILLV